MKSGIVDLIRARLSRGDLGGAADLLLRIPSSDQERVLHSLADDVPESLGIAVYGLIASLLQSVDNQVHWHGHASVLLVTALCWMSGAYALAYYHACRVVELNPNDADSLEFCLFFAEGPHAVLNVEDAMLIASKVLEMKPESEIAKKYIPKN